MEWKSGEIIDEKYFYRLEAKDFQGRTWNANKILPDRKIGEGGAVVVGKVSTLISTEGATGDIKVNFIRIHYSANIKFPSNTWVKTETSVGEKVRSAGYHLSLARFNACSIQFEIRVDDGSTVLSASSEQVQFDDKTINCILDAFTFVTGNSLPWVIIDMYQKEITETRLQASWDDQSKSRIGPPIQDQSPTSPAWTLFERFLSYGLNSSDSVGHPLGELVRSVLVSGKSDLSGEARTLSVSVETLLVKYFSELCVKDNNLNENIDKAKRVIKEATELDTTFKNRLIGAINAMPNLRAKDYLFVLRDQKLIEPSLVETYGNLRNPSAHGVTVDWGDLQTYINQCGSVLVLFYQLLFLRIGYVGTYTDYGTYDWPQKEFRASLSRISEDSI